MRGIYFVKEVFLRLCHFLRLSLLLCRYDAVDEHITSLTKPKGIKRNPLAIILHLLCRMQYYLNADTKIGLN